MKWLIYMILYMGIKIVNGEDVGIISRTRTTFLDNYVGYVDAVIIRMEVPKDSMFASFKFVADETQTSFIGCSPRKVSVYVKYGSLPVINPDGSRFPSKFKNITRPTLFDIEMESDKKDNYLNITSPKPGSYYIATFLAYTDPNDETIKPEGLIGKCYAQVEASLYVSKLSLPEEIVDDYKYTIEDFSKPKIYKFLIPDGVDHATLSVNVSSAANIAKIIVRIASNQIPSSTTFVEEVKIDFPVEVNIPFRTKESSWYFVEFTSQLKEKHESSVNFQLKYFYVANKTVDPEIYGSAIQKIYRGNNITKVVPYKQYNLLKESSATSFQFTFDIRKSFESTYAPPINITSDNFVALQFSLQDFVDIGGSLAISIAFKPTVIKKLQDSSSYKIIGCIKADAPAIPLWPDLCDSNGIESKAQLIITKSTVNDTMMIPFPESGVWFATFKLFCNECIACDCSKNCQEKFEDCQTNCEMTCSTIENCSNCGIDCKNDIVQEPKCDKCNCDGPCLQNDKPCNTSLLFDISAYPCTGGRCGTNGKCVFSISDGVVYTSCICFRNYRGWDCTDDSQANPYWLVVLELLLLVLSNLMFLPVVIVAYRRKYYIEAITYFSICFFSTFYHACDAGEDIISMCITKLNALQFADFFCALLAIWVTMIAIADLPSFIPNFCHVVGAIVLSFLVTLNKTSVWVFTIPATIGVIIIIISWYIKYRKIRQNFIKRLYYKCYLPIGLIIVIAAVIIFGLLQTKRNYKYLHSLWHVLMAVAVIILLPQEDTFLPETRL